MLIMLFKKLLKVCNSFPRPSTLHKLHLSAKNLYSRFSKTYARSKLAQIMNAAYMTKVLRATNPTTKLVINACHPGTVDTNLIHNTPFSFPIIQTIMKPFTWFFLKTDQDGAQTPLFLALSKKIDGISGKYFR